MCGIWGLFSSKSILIDNVYLYKLFMKIKHRGPDRSIFINNDTNIVGFHRLAIMDTSSKGDQPFTYSYYYNDKDGNEILKTIYLICNGEIYNFKEIKEDENLNNFLTESNYKYKSESDCEVILTMYLKSIYNLENTDDNINMDEILNRLNGEFAFAIYDIDTCITSNIKKYKLYLARDRFGIRPLFYSLIDNYTIGFSSEMKSLINITEDNKVCVFDPRSWSYFSFDEDENLINKSKYYYEVGKLSVVLKPELTDVYRSIKNTLIDAIRIRLNSDREIGCLLSGGLDSSLIASIAARELSRTNKKLRTFSIGMSDSPDVHYAKIVADHIGSIHTNIEIPESEWINSIEKIIEISETFDITTIRATTGQYLISKWISENTDIKVLLIGDGSDEVTGGYLYFHKSPTPNDLHFECRRLVNYIHYFDVLRADRGVASNGLEARVPFLDYNFVNLYFKIDPLLRLPQEHITEDGITNKYEKYLLRKAFDKTDYLPKCVLWRRKEAFSDGVSSNTKSWYQIIQEDIESKISNEYFENAIVKYNGFLTPYTKESLYYHEIYDKYYPNQYDICPYYWLPKWIENVNDPSARTLDIYN